MSFVVKMSLGPGAGKSGLAYVMTSSTLSARQHAEKGQHRQQQVILCEKTMIGRYVFLYSFFMENPISILEHSVSTVPKCHKIQSQCHSATIDRRTVSRIVAYKD